MIAGLLSSRLTLPVMLGGGVLIAIMWAYIHVKGEGVQQEKNRVEGQNNEAIQAANDADMSRSECNSTDGMQWDFAAGKCVGR